MHTDTSIHFTEFSFFLSFPSLFEPPPLVTVVVVERTDEMLPKRPTGASGHKRSSHKVPASVSTQNLVFDGVASAAVTAAPPPTHQPSRRASSSASSNTQPRPSAARGSRVKSGGGYSVPRPPPPVASSTPQEGSRRPLPLTPVTGSSALPAGNATRVSRLLRDARAAVDSPLRPETPLDLVQGSAVSYLRRRGGAGAGAGRAAHGHHGTRLAALPTHATSSNGGGGTDSLSGSIHGSPVTTLSSSSLVLSPSAPSPAYPDTFLEALRAAEGRASTQTALLRELDRWLTNPTHAVWPEMVTYLARLMQLASTAQEERCSMAVGVVVASVLLRHTPVERCPALEDAVFFLRAVAESGLTMWLERELLFEPLLYFLRCEDILQRGQTEVVLEVLSLLRYCTQPGPMTAPTSASSISSPATSGQEAESSSATRQSRATITASLVTLGVIPALSTLARRALEVGGSSDGVAAARVLSGTFLVLRYLCTDYAHHLLKFGAIEVLLNALDRFATDTAMVEAAARALAQLAFDADGLAALQASPRLLPTITNAVAVQLAAPSTATTTTTTAEEPGESAEASAELSLSRLCSVLVRVAEHSSAQQDYLATHAGELLLGLVTRYVRVEVAVKSTQRSSPGLEGQADGAGDDGDASFIQLVVWLVGIVAMSPQCGVGFVTHVMPPLLSFLSDSEPHGVGRLTYIYTLMCVSNLSYSFAAVERAGGSAETEAVLPSLYATLGPILAGCLFDGDVEATVEATRTLGNVSFTNAGRDWMEANRCDEVVVLFLGHEDLRVVYNCFGVVLNLTAGTNCRLVEDASLLRTLLQYTGRFTTRDSLDVIALEALDPAEPKLNSPLAGSATMELQTRASYAEQIADLVEKVLNNVQGLVTAAATATA